MHPIGRTYAWTRSYHPPQPSRWSRVCQWRVEGGLEAWLTKPRSIDSDAFISFIEGLVAQNQSEEITLFLDNATIHRSKKVTSFLKDRG